MLAASARVASRKVTNPGLDAARIETPFDAPTLVAKARGSRFSQNSVALLVNAPYMGRSKFEAPAPRGRARRGM